MTAIFIIRLLQCAGIAYRHPYRAWLGGKPVLAPYSRGEFQQAAKVSRVAAVKSARIFKLDFYCWNFKSSKKAFLRFPIPEKPAAAHGRGADAHSGRPAAFLPECSADTSITEPAS
ncbi:hypothetical protein KTE26_00905 [Ralstonia mannitolilytica]|uniref:hypothetical protein n=1 Tax=Ralstonia mannitolilytica TaxID=105219 RepID=UPI0013158DF0|nr:hypothetical protein [Ralstonia mannitolilytica]MBU9576991.1 hypothetical protein [Ralstonia mannitolilytica]